MIWRSSNTINIHGATVKREIQNRLILIELKNGYALGFYKVLGNLGGLTPVV